MNDRYLYKAKRIDNGEWVEGFLFDDGMMNPEHYFIGSIVIEPYKGTADDDWNITGHCFYEVDPSTICQCTGLKDKNGKLIWENDKCVVTRQCVLAYGIIKYSDGCFCFVEDKTGNILRLCDVKTNGFEIKVESNIFDNPELLEVGE